MRISDIVITCVCNRQLLGFARDCEREHVISYGTNGASTCGSVMEVVLLLLDSMLVVCNSCWLM